MTTILPNSGSGDKFLFLLMIRTRKYHGIPISRYFEWQFISVHLYDVLSSIAGAPSRNPQHFGRMCLEPLDFIIIINYI